MSTLAIRSALERHLKGLTPAWPTEYENVTFSPPANGLYQRAFVLFGQTVAAGFGKAATERWTGTLQVNIVIPRNKGTGPASQREKAIRDWFPRGTALFDADETVKVVCETPYPKPGMTSETEYVIPVIIPWFAYI